MVSYILALTYQKIRATFFGSQIGNGPFNLEHDGTKYVPYGKSFFRFEITGMVK